MRGRGRIVGIAPSAVSEETLKATLLGLRNEYMAGYTSRMSAAIIRPHAAARKNEV